MHPLEGCAKELISLSLTAAAMSWLCDQMESNRSDLSWLLADAEYFAHCYLIERKPLPKKKATKKKVVGAYQLQTERRVPVSDPWMYAYLIHGEKKIGKTSFAIEGCEEFVMQCDKPQLAYPIREEILLNFKHALQVLKAIEALAAKGNFPYTRIIVDGVGELYMMCQQWACAKHGVNHPSDNENFGATWSLLKESFNDFVNRLLRLQTVAECGLMFISHSQWKERKVRGGAKLDRLEPLLPNACGEIINGKVDAWFAYDYAEDGNRVLITQGDEETGAGHRIDGRFLTPEGDRVSELPMGANAQEALANFISAFNNEWPYSDYEAWRQEQRRHRTRTKVTKKKSSKKKATKKKSKISG